MYLEIISPEAILLQAEVSSVTVPGINGEFQMLENHAAIVALLGEGLVKFDGNPKFDERVRDKFSKDDKGKWVLPIKSGTVEMNNNRVVVLAD